MLVLLVMLIITIPIQLHAVNLNMPTGNRHRHSYCPSREDRRRSDEHGHWNGEVVPTRDG
jgi:biopolymer transport protein ExbD